MTLQPNSTLLKQSHLKYQWEIVKIEFSHKYVKHMQQTTDIYVVSYNGTHCDCLRFTDLALKYRINTDKRCELH